MRFDRGPAAVAAMLVVLLGLVGCAKKAPLTRSSEVLTANSLEELVSNSDAVISGAVINVEPGRVVGEAAPEQLTQLSVRVDRVMFGSLTTDVVLVEESSGIPTETSQVGQSGIFFLHLKDDNQDVPYYRLVSSQGRFIERSETVVPSNNQAPWVKELERMTPPEFEKAVADAIASTSAAE